MRISAMWLVLSAACLAAAPERDSLKAIRDVEVVVEDVGPDLQALGMLGDTLKTEVEARLRTAGIEVLAPLPAEADQLARMERRLDTPLLDLDISVWRSGPLVAYSVDLDLSELVVSHLDVARTAQSVLNSIKTDETSLDDFRSLVLARLPNYFGSVWTKSILGTGELPSASVLPPYPEPPPGPNGGYVYRAQLQRDYEARKGEYYLKLSLANATAQMQLSASKIRDSVATLVDRFISDWSDANRNLNTVPQTQPR